MSREVRRVPANWQHPVNAGGFKIPMYSHFPYNDEEIAEGLSEGWLSGGPPNYGCDVMPNWPEADRTHWQMYETTSEGTPISPVMDSPESLARWLADNGASAGPYATATYEQWLAMIRVGHSVGTFVIAADGRGMSGVAAVSGLADR